MDRKKYSQKDGFSLVELIVVIAVSTILVGGVALGVGMLRSADTKKTAYAVNSGLTELKSKNMAMGTPTYMHINRFNDTYYLTYTGSDAFTPDGSGKELGGKTISITATYEKWDASGNITYENKTLSDGGDICVGISKKDGSFIFQPEPGGGQTAPCMITVSAGTGVTHEITMVTETGKHFVEVK